MWFAAVAVALLVLATVAGWAIFVRSTQPDAPGEFYSAPDPLPEGPPGTIIRSEVIDGFRPGATAYRVLYTSTGYDGNPTAVSGFVLVPEGEPPADGRKVVAYTHGTVGVASNCAPSLVTSQEQQPLFVEGGDDLLAAGYVVAASDYQGLGTPGPHPYLVGESEGMNALDSVRAARNLSEAGAGDDFVVWGHSQGGHAALFTAQLAASYAPELSLVGVAAGAPVPNLRDLFAVNIETTVGRVLIAMALQLLGAGVRRREPRRDRDSARAPARAEDRPELPVRLESDPGIRACCARPRSHLSAQATVGRGALGNDHRDEHSGRRTHERPDPARAGRCRPDRRA